MKTGTYEGMTRRDILMKASNDAMTIQDLNGNIKALNIKRKKQIEAMVREGLFPACAVCKRIRNDRGSWHQIESYTKRHGEKELMQMLCVQCSEVDYPWIKSHHLNH